MPTRNAVHGSRIDSPATSAASAHHLPGRWHAAGGRPRRSEGTRPARWPPQHPPACVAAKRGQCSVVWAATWCGVGSMHERQQGTLHTAGLVVQGRRCFKYGTAELALFGWHAPLTAPIQQKNNGSQVQAVLVVHEVDVGPGDALACILLLLALQGEKRGTDHRDRPATNLPLATWPH